MEKAIREQGLEPGTLDPEAFATVMWRDAQTWTRIATGAKITADWSCFPSLHLRDERRVLAALFYFPLQQEMMPMTSTVRYQVSEGVATLALSRPEALNAINADILAELRRAGASCH